MWGDEHSPLPSERQRQEVQRRRLLGCLRGRAREGRRRTTERAAPRPHGPRSSGRQGGGRYTEAAAGRKPGGRGGPSLRTHARLTCSAPSLGATSDADGHTPSSVNSPVRGDPPSPKPLPAPATVSRASPLSR